MATVSAGVRALQIGLKKTGTRGDGISDARRPINNMAARLLVVYSCALNGISALRTPKSPLRMRAEPKTTPPKIWAQQAGAMWISAALLGPVCDGRHSSHDVLHYATDSIAGAPWIFQAPNGVTVLETCWWVPVAFGGAGLILGVAHPLLDMSLSVSLSPFLNGASTSSFVN